MSSTQYDHITDAQLLENYYSDQNSDWIGILLQRYTLLLYGVCMKYLKDEEEAKDAVQQVFLKAISELRKYRVTFFKSWLYMIARNYCLMQLRDKGKYFEPVTESTPVAAPDNREDLIKHQQKEETLELMKMAIEKLSQDQKECIKMFYLQKQSYATIAEVTGYTLMQVKSHIQNGKRNLKILLEKQLKSIRSI